MSATPNRAGARRADGNVHALSHGVQLLLAQRRSGLCVLDHDPSSGS